MIWRYLRRRKEKISLLLFVFTIRSKTPRDMHVDEYHVYQRNISHMKSRDWLIELIFAVWTRREKMFPEKANFLSYISSSSIKIRLKIGERVEPSALNTSRLTPWCDSEEFSCNIQWWWSLEVYIQSIIIIFGVFFFCIWKTSLCCHHSLSVEIIFFFLFSALFSFPFLRRSIIWQMSQLLLPLVDLRRAFFFIPTKNGRMQ